MELEKSWASAMQQDHSDFAKHHNDRKSNSTSQQRRQRFRPMWRVREHMAFLIRNFQFYIQVTYHKNYSNIMIFAKVYFGGYFCGIRPFLWKKNTSTK